MRRAFITAALPLLIASSAVAQELISVNLWSTGKPSSPSIWVDDPEAVPMIQLDGATSAGIFPTTAWENFNLGNPFSFSTPATAISGTGGASATFEMLNRRNSSPYNWNPPSIFDVRLPFDVLPGNEGNAALLDSHVSSTEFDNANGTGNPFGYRIGDYEIRDIPFSEYSVAIYFGINRDQSYLGEGNIRINDDVVRPTDLSGTFRDGVVAQAGIDAFGGTKFTLPTTADGFEPDGVLDEIEFEFDTGNYIVYEGLTDSTFKFQTWGTGFTHLGAAGFQILNTGEFNPPPMFTLGDTNNDGTVDTLDIDPFVLLLTDPAGYATAFPGVDAIAVGDINMDTVVDTLDIDPFVALLTAGSLNGGAVPEPGSIVLLGLAGVAGLTLVRRRK